ncbi:hypothetical protein E4T42_09267 [Aureobasidium subglaciale]|nr:hypothetical protein E4T42_09267 [Aureobasidium subglaciale]
MSPSVLRTSFNAKFRFELDIHLLLLTTIAIICVCFFLWFEKPIKNLTDETPASAFGGLSGPSELCQHTNTPITSASTSSSVLDELLDTTIPGTSHHSSRRSFSPTNVEGVMIYSPSKAMATNDTLIFVADFLEDRLGNFAHPGTDIMLAKFQRKRSTMGSQIPLFGREHSGIATHAFEKEAWYGESCPLDAMIWSLKKRLSGVEDSNMVFSGFEEKREKREQKETKGVEEPKEDLQQEKDSEQEKTNCEGGKEQKEQREEAKPAPCSFEERETQDRAL